VKLQTLKPNLGLATNSKLQGNFKEQASRRKEQKGFAEINGPAQASRGNDVLLSMDA
jgi:hypothetical protein